MQSDNLTKNKSYTLEESVSHLIDYRGKTPKKTNSGIPLVTAKIVKKGRLEPYNEFIGEDNYDSWMIRGIPKKGDIVLTVEAPLGEVAQLDDTKIALAQRIVTLRGKKNILNNDYLLYLLQSREVQSQLEARSSGSTVKGIKQSELRKVVLNLPPLVTQKKIANILSTLDDKIELNRKMNQTLEEMAQALFKSWFVDFDPVNALKNRDGEDLETIASNLGISKEVLELFPSEFEESELGMIPKGWRVSTIEDEVSIYGGATPSTKEDKYWLGGKNHWATPRDLSGLNSKVLIDSSRKITDDGVNKISSKQLPTGTILLSSRAPVGYIAYSTVPISINQGFIAMVCNKQLSNYFVMYWLDIAMSEIKNRAIGTTFAEISKSSFRPIKLVVPTQEILFKFNNQVQPMVDKIIKNENEIKTLQKTRDTLLPKLLSGELDVSRIDTDNLEDN